MTADLTDIRARHSYHVKRKGVERCGVDDFAWPCDAAVLLNMLDAARPSDDLTGLDVERLRVIGFDPPDNICATCHHPGGEHDLMNWCLTCPRPAFKENSFQGRVDAGWDYFSSMTDEQKWAYGAAEYAALARLEPGEGET